MTGGEGNRGGLVMCSSAPAEVAPYMWYVKPLDNLAQFGLFVLLRSVRELCDDDVVLCREQQDVHLVVAESRSNDEVSNDIDMSHPNNRRCGSCGVVPAHSALRLAWQQRSPTAAN